jgi:ribosomal protein L21
MPLTSNVGKNIKELERTHPDWSHKRVVAASLNAARKKGAHIPQAQHTKRKTSTTRKGHRRSRS